MEELLALLSVMNGDSSCDELTEKSKNMRRPGDPYRRHLDDSKRAVRNVGFQRPFRGKLETAPLINTRQEEKLFLSLFPWLFPPLNEIGFGSHAGKTRLAAALDGLSA